MEINCSKCKRDFLQMTNEEVCPECASKVKSLVKEAEELKKRKK